MSLLAYISLVLCSIIIIRATANLYNLSISLRCLKAQRPQGSRPITEFHICIPVLNEQDTIVETVNTLLRQSYPASLISLYIVTTSKEKLLDGRPSTRNVIDNYLIHLSANIRKRIHVVNYPEADGHMAHQINFLANRLRAELSNENAYFVIYNADSHIHKDIFSLVDFTVSTELKQKHRRPTILQQSAVYQYAGTSHVAEGAGLHQTLWTLIHEIPRLFNQSSKVLKLSRSSATHLFKYSRIAHCVGHGLFVRGDYYNKHPLPQDILNEDLPYGLLACALREPIYPIPSLELASTPSKVTNVYRQKSTWFNPFFEFISYSKNLIRQGLYVSKLEVSWLLFQAYFSLAIWFAHSIVLTGGLVISVFAGWQYVIMWLVAFFAYWILPALIVTRERRFIDNGGSNSYASILAGIPYVLTHSVGPFMAAYGWFSASIQGIKPIKHKTETS